MSRQEEELEARGGLTASGRVLASDFQLIPNEIALLIFAYLNMKDLLHISQTCKHWNNISEDDSLWKPLYKARWSPSSFSPVTSRARAFTNDSASSSSSSSSAAVAARRARSQRLRRRQANGAASDHEQIAGWRSWKNKYITRRNWLDGRVMGQSKLDIHARSEGESLECVRFDNEKYAAGSTDGAVYVRAVEDGRPLQTLRGHTQTVTCMQMQDNVLVTGSKDNTVKIWRGLSGAQECELTLAGHRGAITCLQFAGHHLMTRSWDLTGRVWDMNTGQIVHTVTGNSVCLSLQVENSKLVCGYADNYIRLWDLRTGKCHRHLYGHSNIVTAVRFDDTMIASGSYDRTLRLWDIRSHQSLCTLTQHKGRINALQLQGQRIVSASTDHTVKVWNAKTRQFLFDLKGHTSAVNDVQFDEKKVVSADEDGSIRLWNFAETMPY